MYRIKVFRNNGRADELVIEPARTFDSLQEIEDYMENYKDCWCTTNFA